MHSLHRLLIDITDPELGLDDNMSKEEQIDLIRNFALTNSVAQGYAYDWRTETDAGRWSDQYPNNLVLGKDDPQLIIDEVLCGRNYQDHYMDGLIIRAKDENIDNLETRWEIVKTQDSKGSTNLLDIQLAANFLSGNYTFDSCFLFVNDDVPIVCDYIIDKVTNDPSKFAILFTDCHW